MQRFIKSLICGLLLAGGWQQAAAYSLGGPIGNAGDTWQQAIIGYGLGGDLNAPKNIGEEYRRNVPVVYYTFDANFYDYFGAEGATAVMQSFAILNSLTNVDNFSKQLIELPMESRGLNNQAQALGLYDLKSVTLGAMMEQVGLADPIRYNWTLHDRLLPSGGTCPANMEYLVVQRNFDVSTSPLTRVQYSPYINNTLYTYQIVEFCTGSNPLALSVPYAVDPLADTYSPVAGSIGGIMYVPVDTVLGTVLSLTYVPGITAYGSFYTGLTRDDVGGLRYLISTNNVNWESPAPGTVLISTNTLLSQPFPVSPATNGFLINGTYYGTSSYGALTSFAKTNSPAVLAGQYPGLQFTLVSNDFVLVTVTNVISYFTNFIGSPAGTPGTLVITTNLTVGIQEQFFYTFDNIVTNVNKATTTTKVQTIKVGPAIGSPAGSPSVTNITTKTITLNTPDIEFYILPTNSPCGLDIYKTIYTFTNYTTNVLISTLSGTNGTGTTSSNFTTQAYAQIQIIPNLSHVYLIHPVTCDQAPPDGLYRGIGRITYYRADYDSLLGQFWQPVTNDYSMTIVTNSRAATLKIRRVVTQPDYLFSAQDLTSPPSDSGIYNLIYSRNVNFDQANILPGLAGPGTIQAPTTISFNKDGPVYFNTPFDVMDGTPYFNQTPGGDIDNLFYASYFVWGSFDGSTNDPVVYPSGTSIENLQNQLLVQLQVTDGAQNVLTNMPMGIAGQPYGPVTFAASGGAFTPPFTWSNPDLVLKSIGLDLADDGTLSGTPVATSLEPFATYDFTVKLTDVNGRSVSWNFPITIQQP